ncbi:MAG: NlpC/P60 family protein [Clostridium sp.]|uniref:C40 family peptidase n=1 Tax=Clostridium sp. TaxID=1506 RepID=UPI003D6CAFC3
MKNALRSIAVIITLIFTSNVTTLAIPTNEKVQQQKDLLTKIQDERGAIETRLEEFDNEIEEIMTKTEENKVKILKTKKAIESAAAKAKQVEKETQKEQELFNVRMRILYMNGFDGYLSVILEAESFGDFVSRVENIKTIIEFDNKVVAEFKVAKKELIEKQQSLNNTKEVLLNLQVQNKQKLDKIIITKESQNKLIAELKSKEIVSKELHNKLITELKNSKENILVAQISESEVSASKSITKINEIRKSAPKYTPSRGSAAISNNAIVAYASNFLGTPYLWGGTSPSGFDCSGFTQYVYAHFGISVGRTTFDQINDGVQVSRDNLQPGDLVFFGTFANPHHMGIYVGDNNYIHAPRTGDVIKVSAMVRKDYVTGRRVK